MKITLEKQKSKKSPTYKDIKHGQWFCHGGGKYIKLRASIGCAANLRTGQLFDFTDDTAVKPINGEKKPPKQTVVKFEQIKVGEVFMHNKTVLIRTIYRVGSGNAVVLKDGSDAMFDSSHRVFRTKANLTVKVI